MISTKQDRLAEIEEMMQTSERWRDGWPEEFEWLIAEVKQLRAAAMKLNDYWISDTYSPGKRNVTVRESAFAELRDLLGLKPKTY